MCFSEIRVRYTNMCLDFSLDKILEKKRYERELGEIVTLSKTYLPTIHKIFLLTIPETLLLITLKTRILFVRKTHLLTIVQTYPSTICKPHLFLITKTQLMTTNSTFIQCMHIRPFRLHTRECAFHERKRAADPPSTQRSMDELKSSQILKFHNQEPQKR